MCCGGQIEEAFNESSLHLFPLFHRMNQFSILLLKFLLSTLKGIRGGETYGSVLLAEAARHREHGWVGLRLVQDVGHVGGQTLV